MLSSDQVRTAFVSVLGREPESELTIEYHMRFPDLLALSQALRNSEEFLLRQRMHQIRKGSPTWVNVDIPSNMRIWIDLEDDGVSMGCLAGSWEPTETDFIVSQLKAGQNFLDIGANLGWFSLYAAQAVGPTGHIYAIEPRSTTFQALKRTINENEFSERCTLWNTALGEDSRISTLAWAPSERNQGHTFLLPPSELLKPGLEGERVEIARLDDLNISRKIRVIKIDVEGAEPSVIRGGMKLIEKDLPIVVAEVFPRSLKSQGEDPNEFLKILEPLGYKTYLLTDNGIGRAINHCGTDLDSYYYYFSVVMLSQVDQAVLLNRSQDNRVQDLERKLYALQEKIGKYNDW